MRKIMIILFVLALIAPVQVAMAATPKKGGSLVVCQPGEPPGLDPTANTAAAIDRVVYANIYEGLIKVNRTGQFVPGLATKWEVSNGIWSGPRLKTRLTRIRSFFGASQKSKPLIKLP
jgi:peptide/nickel transport system substrate-binding protein